jgi:hypothetical protein
VRRNLSSPLIRVADLFTACLELVPLYAVTNDMNAVEFANFTKPTNFTAQILLAHFWMLTHVLQRHSLGAARAYAVRDEVLFQWVQTAAQRLPESYKRYVLWPLGMARVQAAVERGIGEGSVIGATGRNAAEGG